MNLRNYTPVLLLLLIVVYFSQGIVYGEEGSLLSRLTLLIILATSGFYMIKTWVKGGKKPLFYKAWTLLLLLNVFGFIFTADFSNSLYFGRFKTILIVSLPFYPFYHFAKESRLQQKHLIWFFLAMVAIAVLQFYDLRSEILLMRRSGNEDVVNNAAYIFVFLLPYLFLLKNRKIVSMIIAFVILFFIIQGAKRGAMISGGIGLLFFAYYHLKTIEKRNRFRGVILVLAGISALAYFGYDYYIQNDFLISRMKSIGSGDTSGRNYIYANIFNAWYNSDNFPNLLFGYGFGSSIKLSGSGSWAHNDWLELLSNFGLFGVFTYLFLFKAAIGTTISKNWNNDKRILMLAIISIWFFTTLVSMNYSSLSSIFQSVILAYLIGSSSNSIVIQNKAE